MYALDPRGIVRSVDGGRRRGGSGVVIHKTNRYVYLWSMILIRINNYSGGQQIMVGIDPQVVFLTIIGIRKKLEVIINCSNNLFRIL